MANDKEQVWSDGESKLWYSPNSNLDVTWSNGESFVIDSILIYSRLIRYEFTAKSLTRSFVSRKSY